MIRIQANSEVPIYRQIVDGVRLAVVSGRLKPGDELPSVRALAVDLKVNANTIARAFRELEVLGVVETRRGTGTYVAASAERAARGVRRELIEKHARDLVRSGRQAGLSADEILQVVRVALASMRGEQL